tara:strand:+ start:1181 stop:1399 length:219 start_codon:yes stop_codon:yes gene_type:complete
MKFTLDDKEYESDNLNEKGLTALSRLQEINSRKQKMSAEFNDLSVLMEHHTKILKDNLPEETKEEELKVSSK